MATKKIDGRLGLIAWAAPLINLFSFKPLKPQVMAQAVLVTNDQSRLKIQLKKGQVINQLDSPDGDSYIEYCKRVTPDTGEQPLDPNWDKYQLEALVDAEITFEPGERHITADGTGTYYIRLPRD